MTSGRTSETSSYEYVRFRCPSCGLIRQFVREDRWGMPFHVVTCFGKGLGGYVTCTAKYLITSSEAGTFVRGPSGYVRAMLTNQEFDTLGAASEQDPFL